VIIVAAPKVDVLIPAFNAASTVREAVDSILAQTLRDIRVVVVDDGSTDETGSILAELAQRDPRLTVVARQNSGIVDALNQGLDHCRADVVARFDADDIAFPIRLARQLEYLEAHPGCIAVGSAVEHIDEFANPLHGLPHPGQPSLADPHWAPAREPYLIHPFMMARRASVEEVGRYRHVPNSEDTDLYWRLRELGGLYNIEEPLGRYRVHSASVSSASIVGGRIMAVSSQLTALSALRRERGEADIAFDRNAMAEYRAAASFDSIVRVASRQLTASEAQHLRIASAMKLLELARYRPYEPDVADCAFIRAALPFAARLGEANRREVDWYVTVTAARLMRKGMLRAAFALTPPQSYPVAAARVLLSR
jgi:glycosyltransferase involved in cell wall biosynthesis